MVALAKWNRDPNSGTTRRCSTNKEKQAIIVISFWRRIRTVLCTVPHILYALTVLVDTKFFMNHRFLCQALINNHSDYSITIHDLCPL